VVEEGRLVHVVLACHNRVEKTTQSVTLALEAARRAELHARFVVFDDASSDDTVSALLALPVAICIIRGDGKAFWNGGMQRAIAATLRTAEPSHLVLLLNDDTALLPSALAQLCEVLAEGSNVIAVGSIRDPEDTRTTYGGLRPASRLNRLKLRVVQATGVAPMSVPTFNANAVLLTAKSLSELGGLDACFVHSMGDIDLGYRASAQGFRVLATATHVGTCSRNSSTGTWEDPKLGLRRRWQLMQQPKGLPVRPWFCLCRRHAGPAWPVVFVTPYLRLLIAALRPT
jgi:GT2 family glycosyltransferase